jgi:FkbM family methyltransferase
LDILKVLAAKFPKSWQYEAKRFHFARNIRFKRFITDEPEYALLPQLLSPGDWVIDVGANVGHYTARLSELVGAEGRVVAFEPIPETFAILASNARLFAHQNVTLINAAMSDRCDVVRMDMPLHESGLDNFYQARISSVGSIAVLATPLNDWRLDHRISLVKIDAEGHEESVLAGMIQMVTRDRPTLIIETFTDSIQRKLDSLGYSAEHLPGSPNTLLRSPGR